MRKHQQKQILDVLKTIEQAQSAKLYGDCQEGALSLCDFIESIEGNESAGAEVVSLLVDYCELLFKANSGEVGEKTLRKHLVKIENGVTYNLKANRIEMAFISYKAAMADSLETIYLAAKADPNCDAYFIPIPYYEMLPNGQRGQLHYEGEEFYDSNKITITHYKDYNIEQRQPCAIFHFNPYDAGNLVTNVHPDYHFSKLKNFTDMLVYVPYFFTGAMHYDLTVNLPGVVYSNKVILWLNEMKKGCIDEIKKQTTGISRSYLEDKFVVLGSPKIDKVMNSKKEDYTLPNEWSCLVYDKRVVLYNTSLHSLLNSTDNYLSLIEQTLQAFKANPSVVLWWRPHPLIITTLSSMRWGYLERYLKILNSYKAEGWGVLDETQCFHRAITFADAYYGDRKSSVSSMCIAAGKPCMKAVINENNELEFGMYSFVEGLEKAIVTPQDFISYILEDYAVSEERRSKMKAGYASRGLDRSGMVGQKIYEHIKGCVSEQS